MTERKVMPQRRVSETFELVHGGQNTMFQVTLGFYVDNTIGEVFVSGAKAGSDVDALTRDGAVLVSLGLQHGVPVDVMQKAITREPDGRPSTIVGAVVDVIARNARQHLTEVLE